MIAVSISGGKDSTATLLLALNKYGKDKVIPVFQDTGFEHPLTYEYLDYLEDKLGIKIVKIKSREYKDLFDLIRKQKRFPNGRFRFCTIYLKLNPLAEFLAQNRDSITEVWTGIRKNESRIRDKKYKDITREKILDYYHTNPKIPKHIKEQIKHIKLRYPIIDWTEEQVFSYLRENGIEPNPLYEKGFNRVGCFPCILAGVNTFKKAWRDPVGKKHILRLIEIERELKKVNPNIKLSKDFDSNLLLKQLFLEEKQKSFNFF